MAYYAYGNDEITDFNNHSIAAMGTGWNDMSLNQLLNSFNIYGIPDYDNAPVPYIGHLYMSRPSLEISANRSVMEGISQLNGFMTSPAGAQIASSLDRNATNGWLPVVTSRAKNYSVQDVELKSVEKGTTFFGHTITYSKHNEDHKFGGSITIDFRNDKYLSILTMMGIWMFYINNVTRNDAIKVNPLYEEDGILDYCGSLYFILTDWSNHRIVYWDKLTGIRPRKIPFSIFSWDDTTKVEDTVSIDFDFGVRSDPKDPAILLDFNVVGGYDPDSAKSRMESRSGFHITEADPYVHPILKTRPFVIAKFNSYSDRRYSSAKYGTDLPRVQYYLEYE